MAFEQFFDLLWPLAGLFALATFALVLSRIKRVLSGGRLRLERTPIGSSPAHEWTALPTAQDAGLRGRKVIATLQDAVRFDVADLHPPRWTMGVETDPSERVATITFLADVVFTDREVLLVPKTDRLPREEEARVQTLVSYGSGTFSLDPSHRVYESVRYDEVKDVRIYWMGSYKGRPYTKVFVTRRSRFGLPVIAVQFSTWMNRDELRAFLESTPLASKVKRKQQ